MVENNLAALVRKAIRSPSSTWFPGLAAPLADRRKDRLLVECGLVRGSYGLERFLTRDPTLPSRQLAVIPIEFGVSGMVLEDAASATMHYETLGLSFHELGELNLAAITEKLYCALKLLSLSPGCAAAVSALTWTLIPLLPPSHEYDISHSDPNVPFTIFVSLTDAPQRHAALRLAEAVLHETMHLQLSLIEEIEPLVASEYATLYSPWKGEQRPIAGVLHGVYVFRAIDDFLEILQQGTLSESERAYVAERRRDIAGELKEAAEIAQSVKLTEYGRILARRLLAVSR